MADRFWRGVLRNDPCPYCGCRHAEGIDHIDPRVADRRDHTNWAGCCKRCNEIKRVVPLLLALLWVPVSRDYHRWRRLLYTPPG